MIASGQPIYLEHLDVESLSPLTRNLREMEQVRERYWLRYPGTASFKLRWRALTFRHSFHVLPGERILEIGAGSGLWTEHISSVLRGQNPITAAVFNNDLLRNHRNVANARFLKIEDLSKDLPHGTFDYVIGTTVLCHKLYSETLKVILRLLKPGGQILFFEPNYWNPQVWLKNVIPSLGRWAGHAPCQTALRRYELMKLASREGFVEVDIVPYDIVHPRTPAALVAPLQSVAFIMEHAPGFKELCGNLYIWAKKPAEQRSRRPNVCLAEHSSLFGDVSVVVPCRNEEMNVPILVDALLALYRPYLREIIIVDDNSTDDTAAVTKEVASREPCVKLVQRRPPGGVGRALRDGYVAAAGKYILTMDCDFALTAPEFRDLFDVISAGHDGAIGSRFSPDSLLINYPFFKIVCNRAFHLLANLFLPVRVRDISNNLKLYRADILKALTIDQPDFSANVETGLKPLLAGYDIREVPISWINRSSDMGTSKFKIAAVAPNYFMTLLRMIKAPGPASAPLSRE